MSTSDEKKALNEGKFREANEKLESQAQELFDEQDLRVPYLCECPTLECHQVIRLSYSEYEQVRARGNQGFIVPGHEDLTVERVVEERDGYSVVEKFGRAGDVAKKTDPRT